MRTLNQSCFNHNELEEELTPSENSLIRMVSEGATTEEVIRRASSQEKALVKAMIENACNDKNRPGLIRVARETDSVESRIAELQELRYYTDIDTRFQGDDIVTIDNKVFAKRLVYRPCVDRPMKRKWYQVFNAGEVSYHSDYNASKDNRTGTVLCSQDPSVLQDFINQRGLHDRVLKVHESLVLVRVDKDKSLRNEVETAEEKNQMTLQHGHPTVNFDSVRDGYINSKPSPEAYDVYQEREKRKLERRKEERERRKKNGN